MEGLQAMVRKYDLLVLVSARSVMPKATSDKKKSSLKHR